MPNFSARIRSRASGYFPMNEFVERCPPQATHSGTSRLPVHRGCKTCQFCEE
jgi:hypothetical protein